MVLKNNVALSFTKSLVNTLAMSLTEAPSVATIRRILSLTNKVAALLPSPKLASIYLPVLLNR